MLIFSLRRYLKKKELKKKELKQKEKEKSDDFSYQIKEPEKMKKGGIARGCGKILSDRRKLTKYY